MSDPKNVQIPLKVMINKQKTKVLYAEADSEFADVFLSFLTLPLGTIVRVLQKHDPALMLGSITTLYKKSLQSLDFVHFQTEVCKQMLLNPRSSSEVARHKLKFNVDDTDQPTKYFKCASRDCSFFKNPYVSMYHGISIVCDCWKSMLRKEILLTDSIDQGADDGASGVFTKGTVHFIISDDLQILPSGMGNVIRLISNMGITDTDVAELMDVTFGFKEIMDLLKGALFSDTPLTDIVLNKGQVKSFAVKYEMGTLVPPIVKSATTKEMVVKAIIQKSTNKLLYVEGDDNFVEFLFSLFTIPLGGIGHLLGGSTGLKNIDNLYRSLGDINGDMYLKSQATKAMLLNPKLPFGFTSNTQFLPLTEEIPPTLYFNHSTERLFPQDNPKKCRTSVVFKSPKDPGNYIKGPAMYMVTDDLVVTPLCTASGISILNHLRVPLSDVSEQELKIGLEEALRILRASLNSTHCLSDGLINLLLEKKPKQEQLV
ncbi:hypothetical protein CASFOL_020018 [Castilleja foliolosa]|uniref:DUF674 family protein n=1 Tax=Castilleja foliolosa TaxID=1961234 RepID=A0ABD3D375_9LAMI